MNVTICIGSSCHIKGSRRIVDTLQKLIEENNLEEQVELSGSFCMGRCVEGVCVTVDGQFFSVSPETVNAFFKENVLDKL